MCKSDVHTVIAGAGAIGILELGRWLQGVDGYIRSFNVLILFCRIYLFNERWFHDVIN
jgi:hypothetical protein